MKYTRRQFHKMLLGGTMALLGGGAFLKLQGLIFQLPFPFRVTGAWVSLDLEAPKIGTIKSIGFRTSTVTTGANVDVRLEKVSL